MKTLTVLGMGALRILQANFNKVTSGYVDTKETSIRYGAYFEFVAAIFSLLYLGIVGFYGWNTATVICAALSGAGFLAELLTILAAMRSAPIVLCNLCAMGGSVIITAVLGIFYFGEPMSLLQWAGVVLFFAAVWFLSPTEKNSSKKITGKTLLLLLANFLINGILSSIGKYFAVRVENGNAALFAFLCYVFAALFFGLCILFQFGKKGRNIEPVWQPFHKKLYIYGLAVGAVCATIVYLSTILLRIVPVVIANTVPSVISIIGCLFVGALFFKEKINGKNAVGVVLGALSAVLIVTF